MNFRFWKKKEEPEERNSLLSDFNSLMYSANSTGYNTDSAMLLSTVYRCVEVITDSIASLPLEVYKVDTQGYKSKYLGHPAYYLLNKEPNKVMSRFTFMKTLMVSVLLRGNGYAYIERDQRGNAVALHFLRPEFVTIVDSKSTGEIKYSVAGVKDYIEPCNMIHILNFSYDGIHGVSTLKHARKTLCLANDSENTASGFFKGGCNLAGILKVNSTLSQKQKKDLKDSWQYAFSPQTGNPNGVAVLEGNMDFEPITVNPEDAQLLESRQYNVIDICRFFGVSPVKAFDLSKSSYSTIEATQLSFLTDTLSPLLEKIELEFERKIFKPSEKESIDVRFDTSVLLRTDKQSLATYYSTLFQIGVLSPNEIRQTLDLPPLPEGSETFVQVNVQTLSNAIKQSPIEGQGQEPEQKDEDQEEGDNTNENEGN